MNMILLTSTTEWKKNRGRNMYIEIETEMPCPMRWAKSKWRFLCSGQHVKHETADTHKSIHFKGFTFANCSQNNSLKKTMGKCWFECKKKKTKHLWESNKTTVTEKKATAQKFIYKLSKLLKMWRKMKAESKKER